MAALTKQLESADARVKASENELQHAKTQFEQELSEAKQQHADALVAAAEKSSEGVQAAVEAVKSELSQAQERMAQVEASRRGIESIECKIGGGTK